MSEAWADVAAEQTRAVKDAALSNALALLTEEVYSILALTLVGMAVGMATVGLIRIFMAPVDQAPRDMWVARSALLKRLGAAAAGSWTLGIVYVYLRNVLEVLVSLSLLVAVGAALIAAAGNHHAFAPVKMIWVWALRKIPGSKK